MGLSGLTPRKIFGANNRKSRKMDNANHVLHKVLQTIWPIQIEHGINTIEG